MWWNSQWLLSIFQKGALPTKIVYQTSCGVDVHKSFLVATIIKTTSEVQPSYQKKRFSTFNNSILEFKQWLLDNSCRDVCMIDSLVEPYENAVQLLCTIPGVDRNSAITIISEIGTDMTQFFNSKRLCCWAGLTPGNNESAGKKKSVRITRAGVYLKPALVQVAHAAVKSNKSPYYKAKYERIMKRRGKKRAIIAVARMILTAIYHMLSTGEAWNPTDLYKIDMPEPQKNKQKEKAVKQAMKLLIAEGLIKEAQLPS